MDTLGIIAEKQFIQKLLWRKIIGACLINNNSLRKKAAELEIVPFCSKQSTVTQISAILHKIAEVNFYTMQTNINADNLHFFMIRKSIHKDTYPMLYYL